MTATAPDLAREVISTLDESPTDDVVDVDAIVSDLLTLDVDHVDDVSPEAYWALVERHTTTRVDPARTFAAEIVDVASATRPTGVPAVWRGTVDVDDQAVTGVTVSMLGVSRVSADRWPQVLGQITITTPSASITVSGEDISSLAALWALVQHEASAWADTLAQETAEVARAARALDVAERAASAARARRDATIRHARRAGLPATDLTGASGLGLAMVQRIGR